VRAVWFAFLIVVAAASRCDDPHPPGPPPMPKAGTFVKVRGTLSDDVDCRLLRTDDGRTFSLSAKLPSYLNGSKVCVHGTVSEVSQCLTQPMLEVQSIRPWSSCP
jgi:hypothetical protein